MNDPWVDLKGRYMQPLYPVPWLQAIRDVERMTTDADALLTLKEFVEIVEEWATTHDELGIDDERDWRQEALLRDRAITDWMHLAQDKLAALPKHLRGDNNERSRKA